MENNIVIPYYEDNSRINNSAIGWFIKKGPVYLKGMLDGKIEGLKANVLEKGTMIHEYILQPDEFWKDYKILDFTVPKSKQQKEVLDKYNSLLELNPFDEKDKLKLQAYKSVYNNKFSDDKCIKEINKLIETYQQYLEYINTKDNRKSISFADLALLKKLKSKIEEHKKANLLLFKYSDDWEVHNEFHINWEFPVKGKYSNVKCKSLLDRLMINHKEKKIILIDLKTTSNLFDFGHSMELFDYYRQLAFYWMAIFYYFKYDLNININEYEYETYIIGIQYNDTEEIRVFSISPESIEDRYVTIENALTDISWHIENDLWEHTKEYYLGDGVENLC